MGRDRSVSPDRRSRSRRSRSRSREKSESLEKNMIKECWRPVKDNPHDFDAWTRLLKLVEKLNDTKHAREAFDGFLRRYPYCYGYWKKYAEFEKQHKHYEKCLHAYERGLEAIPLSVDLWLSYIAYVKEIAQGQRQATTKIRDVYMRGLEACGLEFRSDKIWEEYIEWEVQNGEVEKAAVLYDVVIMTPTIGYVQHFEKYQAFVNNYEPDKILSAEEYDEITDIVYNRIKDQLDGRPMFFIEEYEDDNIPFDGENYEEMPKKLLRQRKHIDVALKGFRDEIIDRRYKRYVENEREVGMRWTFESEIKRPYFHVKPLEREQLKNWQKYLDFEIKQKKRSRILCLFERCMIACALYEEMWIKYAAYLNSINDVPAAREVYKRATEVHCSRKPGIQLAYSAFEEKEGNIDAALSILTEFDRRHSNYAAISLRIIAIERRRLTKEENEDFSTIVAKYERLIQDASISRRVASFYSLKLARFHAKVRHDRKLARKIIKEAISRDRDNLQLYVQLVDLAFNATHVRDSEVLSALDYAIDSPDLAAEDRFQFSTRKLEYLEEIGCDANELHQHIADHLALEKTLDSPQVTIFHGRNAPLNKEAPKASLTEPNPAAAAATAAVNVGEQLQQQPLTQPIVSQQQQQMPPPTQQQQPQAQPQLFDMNHLRQPPPTTSTVVGHHQAQPAQFDMPPPPIPQQQNHQNEWIDISLRRQCNISGQFRELHHNTFAIHMSQPHDGKFYVGGYRMCKNYDN